MILTQLINYVNDEADLVNVRGRHLKDKKQIFELNLCFVFVREVIALLDLYLWGYMYAECM